MAETTLDENVAAAHKLPGTDNPVTDSSLASAGGMGGGDSGLSTSGTKPATSNRWVPPGAKITIGSLDKANLTVTAQYHPKEIQIDRQVPWQNQISPDVDKLIVEFTTEEGRTLSLDLLFDGYEENESIQGELETLEELSRARVPTKGPQFMAKRVGGSYSPNVDRYDDDTVFGPGKKLEDMEVYPQGHPNAGKLKDDRAAERLELRKQMNEEYKQKSALAKTKETQEKPYLRPHWCFLTWGQWMPGPLDCVIENISTKYLMFAEDGTPLRALVTLRLHEAHGVTMATSKDIQTAAETARAAKQTALGAQGGGGGGAVGATPHATPSAGTGVTGGGTGVTGVTGGGSPAPAPSTGIQGSGVGGASSVPASPGSGR